LFIVADPDAFLDINGSSYGILKESPINPEKENR